MFSFIETKLFTRLVQKYLTDDEYRELQAFLIERPDAGDVIPGSGGVYPKNVTENIPAHVLREIRKEVEDG